VNAAILGRPKDRVRHLGQRAPIMVGEVGRGRAIPDQQTSVILELLARAGAFQPAIEGDA
jgi:hypothetical protein